MGWSGILYSPYNSTTESIFALNGTYRKRIDGSNVWEWGIDAPDVRPILAVGSYDGLTGNYNAKYTWCRKERNVVVYESNPSQPATAVVALSNESLKVTFPTPPDDQINCVRFYRTVAGGNTYGYDFEVNWVNKDYAVTQEWEESDEYFSGDAYYFTTENSNDNTEDTRTWEIYRNQYTGTDYQYRATGGGDNFLYLDEEDIVADGSLGSAPALDHDRPPLGSYVIGPSFDGTVFIIKGNKLYFSKSKLPEYWPSDYYVDVSSLQYGGVCLVMYDKQPFFLTKNKIFYIAGPVFTTTANWIPKDMAAKTGTQSQNGAVAVEGMGIFHVGSDGIYLCLPSTDYRHGKDEKISKPLDPIFRGEDKNGVAAVGDLSKSWLVYWEDKIYFGYPGKNDTYPTNMLIYYINSNRVGYFTREEEIHAVTVDNNTNRLLAVDENGYCWEIESKDVTTDGGEAISWEVESKDFTLQTRRHFPRWAKYDVDASLADSATGEVILDGESHQSHTLSEKRKTNRRLITVGNGRRLSHKISGSGPIEIRAVESE